MKNFYWLFLLLYRYFPVAGMNKNIAGTSSPIAMKTLFKFNFQLVNGHAVWGQSALDWLKPSKLFTLRRY